MCFAVVPDGGATAVGLFQVRQLEPGFASAEWGFVIGSAHWGTGLFADGARLVLDFSVDVQEGLLRRSFVKDGRHLDQVLWSILAEDWRLQRIGPAPARVR